MPHFFFLWLRRFQCVLHSKLSRRSLNSDPGTRTVSGIQAFVRGAKRGNYVTTSIVSKHAYPCARAYCTALFPSARRLAVLVGVIRLEILLSDVHFRRSCYMWYPFPYSKDCEAHSKRVRKTPKKLLQSSGTGVVCPATVLLLPLTA